MNVLMIGPARDVKGGMTTVVDNYFEYGLSSLVKLDYCESINDKSKFQKGIKEVCGYIHFCRIVNKYDLVHIHMASGRSTYRKIEYIKKAKKNKKKVVVHIHGGGFADFYAAQNERNKRKIEKGLNLADKVIVLSQEWKQYFLQIIPKEKLEILYNGVEVPKEFNKDYNNNCILFLGRLCEEKGVYKLLEAIKVLSVTHPDIKLNICGSGEEDKILKYIRDNSLSNNVKLIGWVAKYQREKQLKENSIFVLPSKYEAMPMSLLEAMAYRNIPVCTNVGGIPQIIQDGTNGILIKKYEVKSIIEALEKVLDCPQKKKYMAEISYKTVEEKFNIERNVRLLYEIYLKVWDK